MLLPFKLEGQYQFEFEIDSSGADPCELGPGWTQVPAERWCKDTVLPIAGGSSLHHHFDSSQESCDYLVFRHDPLNIQDSFAVSFRIRHGFLPSSMNNWQLAIGAAWISGSDGEDGVPGIQSGLILGVNYTGSDDLLKIWQVDEGLSWVLCPTTLNYQEEAGSNLAPFFRIQGDGQGELKLYWSPDPAVQLPELLASFPMDGISWGRQVVLRYCYTSSRDRALWLDDLVLEGRFEKDTLAPVISGVKFPDASSLQLDFSEQVDLADDFKLMLYSDEFPGGWTPEDIQQTGMALQACFPEMIPNRISCQLVIQGVKDLDGNLMADTSIQVLRNSPAWGDVVFNEIMVDPEPAIRQVEEYLELYNRSDFPVDPEGWQLRVNERTYLLDASVVTGWGEAKGKVGGRELLPGEFLLLTGITLPNSGALLSLYDAEEMLIHAASYRVPWEGPDWKKEGGWSLESPDADQPCRISYNWEYSSHPGGGTPGWVNSNRTILEDREAPVLLYAGMGDSGALKLYFSEPLQSSLVPAAFPLSPGEILPDSLYSVDPLRDVLYIHYPVDFQAWTQYQLSLPPLFDCSGNSSEEQEYQAGAISAPVQAMVIINEIMYDPEEGKPEYVELFVPGPAFLDLQDLAIHLVEEGGSPDHPFALSLHSRLAGPGQYLVLTTCVPHLEEAYGLEVSGQWVEVDGLPGLNNNGGSIFLTDRAGQVVDMVTYSDAMHMELLDDPRGISLERISADRPGSDPDNWHSAASTAAYATPGRANSQSLPPGDSELLLQVSPRVFSPDNDGYEDLLEVTINTGGNDWVIGLLITDLQGRKIRILANNHLAGPSVSYFWDGAGEQGARLPMGFYVIHARGYHPLTGEQWIRRRGVGLVYR